MAVLEVTNNTFQKEVLESSKSVIVDFWASWCNPCRMMSPTIEKISEDNPAIKVCKVNVDNENELATKYGVMSIPFFAAFKNGQMINSCVGVQSEDTILDLLN
ncbi:MAG: thioredoxin [Treponema sp.]|jgi:thioredoxin 1|nr:thioredoxin [Treponema sp.]